MTQQASEFITDAFVDWADGFANSPSLKLIVGSLQGLYGAFTYRVQGRHNGKWYIGVHNDYPWLYRIVWEPAREGLSRGGMTGPVRLQDGTVHDIKDGWCSNTGVFMRDLGLELLDVSLYEDRQKVGIAGFFIPVDYARVIAASFEFDRPVAIEWHQPSRAVSLGWYRIVKQPPAT